MSNIFIQLLMVKPTQVILLLTLATLTLASLRPQPVNISQVNQVYDKDWYSGYLDFQFYNYSAHMHYFYFPSQSENPKEDPLLFWFNGGPGCSSLLGALYQHGPFIFNDAFGFLMKNPESWNMRANTVYIESPAQVGFSYFFLDPQQSYPIWNDKLTAQLNLNSILQFFKTYPQFKGRKTFIAGQSYGGIYIPTLGLEIHNYNMNEPDFQINFQGFGVGNGCTDKSECEFVNDYPIYLYKLLNDIGVLSDEILKKAEALCTVSDELSQQCLDYMDKVDNMFEGINIYDAYRPCWQNTKNDTENWNLYELRKMAMRTGYKVDEAMVTFAPPCVDSLGIDLLLNDYDNRIKMGIPQNVQGYSMCVPENVFNYTRSQTGSYYVYEKLLPLNKYKIVIYSGDSDPAVPISGTLMWMKKIKDQLGLTTQTYWKPWMIKTDDGIQNTGSFWGLSNKLSLVRFKGVGHMAPQWNNQGGTKMINYLLFNEPL